MIEREPIFVFAELQAGRPGARQDVQVVRDFSTYCQDGGVIE